MDDEILVAMDALEDLLDAERAALLVGKLDDVSRLHPQKERLIAVLRDHASEDRDRFKGLHHKVERNQVLLDSALNGIRSVARRLSAIRQVRTSLDTYDSLGRKKSVDLRPSGSLEKRA
ncbi:flagellar biosynthesis protein FlgN [Tateyamaria armeniaca]|uniref:Flagellar biosynthesis protein FlgN n=1 Tax=Tateyamaria armeniaca TaxID=2518930 RepID=A0ABW8UUZ0_9RHOB